MSKFAKTAIAAAMVMGAVVSSSAFAAGNNGTARFYGTIEDSPCSIVPDDHKLEVDMGDIGAAKLTGGGTTTPKISRSVYRIACLPLKQTWRPRSPALTTRGQPTRITMRYSMLTAVLP